ncbi:hypothetical protein PQX77_008554 [Marasmius sp. AFHP31]|nr:hypothetical protein PQX77_008554 [Marasmius sp. AFHP31]
MTNGFNESTNWAIAPHPHPTSTIDEDDHAGDGQPVIQTTSYPSYDPPNTNYWNNTNTAQYPVHPSENYNGQDFYHHNGQVQAYVQSTDDMILPQQSTQYQCFTNVAGDVPFTPSAGTIPQSGYFPSSAAPTLPTFSHTNDMPVNGNMYQSTYDAAAIVPPPPPQQQSAVAYQPQSSTAASDFSSSTPQPTWGTAITSPPPSQVVAAGYYAQPPTAAASSTVNNTFDVHTYGLRYSQPTATVPAPPHHRSSHSPAAPKFASSYALPTDNTIAFERHMVDSQASWDMSTMMASTQPIPAPDESARYRLPQPGSRLHPSSIPPLPMHTVSSQWQEPSLLSTTRSPATTQQAYPPASTKGKGKGKEVPYILDLELYLPSPLPTTELIWDNSTPDTMELFLKKEDEAKRLRESRGRSVSVSVSTPESSTSSQPARGQGKGKGKGKQVVNSMLPPPVPPVASTSRESRAGTSTSAVSSSIVCAGHSHKRSRLTEDGEEDGRRPSGSGSSKRVCEDTSTCVPQQVARIGEVVDPVPENMVAKAVREGFDRRKSCLPDWIAFFRDFVQMCQCSTTKVTTIRTFSGVNHLCLRCVIRLLNDARALTWPGQTTIPSRITKFPKRWARLESLDSALYDERHPLVEFLGHVAIHSRVNKRTGEISYFFEGPVYLWWSTRYTINGRGDPPPPKEEYGERDEVYGFEQPIWAWPTPVQGGDAAGQPFPDREPTVGELEYLNVDEAHVPEGLQTEGGETAPDNPPVAGASASPVQLEEASQVPGPFDATPKGLDSDTVPAPDFSYLHDLLTTPDPFTAFEPDTNANTDGNDGDTTETQHTHETISNEHGLSVLPDSEVQLFEPDSGSKGSKENPSDTGSMVESTGDGVFASGSQSSKSEGEAETVNPEDSTHDGDDAPADKEAQDVDDDNSNHETEAAHPESNTHDDAPPAAGDQSNDTSDADTDSKPSEPGPDEDDFKIEEWIDWKALD